MKYKKNILYKIRRIPAMLGLTALTAASCCEKPMVIEKEPEIITQHDTIYISKTDTTYIPRTDTLTVITDTITKRYIVLFINTYKYGGEESLIDVSTPSIEVVQKCANCDTIDNVFLTPSPGVEWNNYPTSYITDTRNVLQSRLDISPKVTGRGDFNFKPGMASLADSLWFVQNGWTINKGR